MDKILRVVIDTNHIMSAILSKRGASAKLAEWVIREDYFQLLISQPIWKEYRTVADWLIPTPKQREKERILNVINFQAEWIEPTIQLHVCSDVPDNCFLECAVAGKADYLVTKNIKHFPPAENCVERLCRFINTKLLQRQKKPYGIFIRTRRISNKSRSSGVLPIN